jgi:hypothetical protein
MWNYDLAKDYLAGGRKKHDRPLYDRGLRLWKINKWSPTSDITIGWPGYGDGYITYHNDGTTTLNCSPKQAHWGGTWSPLRSYSTRFTIQRYTGITIVQRNFNFYIEEVNGGYTPPKIQGCRQCKQTGLVDKYCYPSTCYAGYAAGQCPDHPDATGIWHHVPCEHGNTDGHTIPRGQTCYFCGGTKKRDYGSKPIRIQWDGSPLKVKDGKIVRVEPSALERMLANYVQPI